MAEKNLRLRVVLDLADKALAPLKRISRGSQDAAGTLKAAREQLKQLEATQKSIGSFREARTGLEGMQAQLQAARNKVRELAKSYGQAGPPTKQMAAAMAAARAEANQLGAQFNTQQQKVQQLRDKLHTAGISTKNLADHDRQLRASIAATRTGIEQQTKALQQQSEAQRKLAKLQQQAQKAAGIGAGMAAGGAVAMYGGQRALRGTAGLLSAGMDFDAQMSKVQALTRLEKTSADYAMLRAQALELGASTMFSATEAAQGQAFLAMAGFDPKAIKGAMPGLLDMAKAGDLDLGRTADISSNILSAFGIDPNKMGNVADTLTKVFTTSNVNLEMLGNTMSYVGPVARAAGVDLETTAAMAGLLGNVGIQGEKGGTALRAMLLRLAAPTGGAAKALAKLNLSAEEMGSMGKASQAVRSLGVKTMDARGKMRPLLDIMDDLAKATKKMGSAKKLELLKTIFGEEPAAAMTELLERAGDGGILKYLEQVKDSAGAASKTAGIMADNLTGDLDEMSSTWEDVRISLFDANQGEIRAWAQTITAGIRSVGDWFKANPVAAQWLVRLVVGFAALTAITGALLIPLGLLVAKAFAVRWMFAKLGLGLPSLLGSFKALGGSAVAAGKVVPSALTAIGLALQKPVKLAIAAGKAVPGALSRMWLAAKGLPSAFVGLGKAAWAGFAKAGFAAKGAAVKVWAYVLSLKAAALASARQAAASIAMYAAMRGPKGIATDALLGLKKLTAASLRAGLGMLAGAFKGLLLPIKLVGRALLMNPIGLAVTAIAGAALLIIKFWNPIKAFFAGFWQGFVQGLAPLAPMFSATFGALGGVLSALAPLWDMLVGALSTVWGWVSQLVAPFEASKQSIEGATQAGQGFGAWLADLVVTLVSIIPKFVQFGADLVSGIINGITGKLAALKDTVVGVASSAASWFKERLGIASPSKVFTQFGGWISEGAANGIEAGQAAVRAAALAMAGAAAAPALAMDGPVSTAPAPMLASRASAAPVAGGHTEIHIHAAPGMDPQAIARAVSQELDRRERQRASRGRSALSDLS